MNHAIRTLGSAASGNVTGRKSVCETNPLKGLEGKAAFLVEEHPHRTETEDTSLWPVGVIFLN